MRFITFVLKNIGRRRFRSTFTTIGVAVAVGAVVGLVGLASGFKDSLVDMYRGRGVDVLVVRAGVTERLTSLLSETLEPTLRAMPEVQEVAPELLDVISFEEMNLIGVTVYGWRPRAMQAAHLTLLDGRHLEPDDEHRVLLGTVLAKNLGKKVGDTVNIYDEPFQVAGIYQSYNMFENGALIIPIKQLQRMMDRPGQATLFDIIVRDPTDHAAVDRLIQRIDGLGKGLSALRSSDYVASDARIQISQAMAWLTSLIALVIGAVGVLNTMAMSVAERTQEIGILRAIGWRPGRVMRMILVEAVILSAAGAALGALGAVLLYRVLSRLPSTNGFISGEIAPVVIAEGFLLALVVGFIGGIYPALRGSRLPPTEALRHE